MAKYLDENGLLYAWTKTKTLLAGKVDTVSGKGLSTNDYTTEEKTKLAAIEADADVNVIEAITVNGTAVTPTNKVANVTVPTNNNELSNGAGYQTASDVTTAINAAIAGISGISYETVEELPASGEAGVIYLVPNGAESGTNIYDEYIYSNGAFEKIGSTETDLSGYLQTSATITNAEIDTIFAS